ncbi:polymer-forming cytoskeletal protein [Photobacterium sp. WH77]|uniref:bactofilin family protein n=1 Tax=Photobacterium TaxID=657 RepID=UPI001EDC4299|nr:MULTISPECIES: polymer-forming cytoskeletal protein [Photobacterium]MCG2836392.1 polymer-forming cytoskeletal protein [Photobacterium sp. WH77]MCG2843981.1 polymer-forming cytoskeletal protein [Photobacterium sp. WH80]
MGLFSKSAGSTSKHSTATIIAQGCSFKGDIELSGNIQVDGYIEGRIRTEQTLSISATGRVSGEIFASKVVINGLHEGACHADSIEILEKGKAKGVIYTNDICIERGGCFHGQTYPADKEKVVTINKEEPVKAAEASPDLSKKESGKETAPLTPPTQLKSAEASSTTDKSAAPVATAAATAVKPAPSPASTVAAPVTDTKKQVNARK